jgi:hypothetical protein
MLSLAEVISAYWQAGQRAARQQRHRQTPGGTTMEPTTQVQPVQAIPNYVWWTTWQGTTDYTPLRMRPYETEAEAEAEASWLRENLAGNGARYGVEYGRR